MMGAVLAGCSNEEVLDDAQVQKKNVQKEQYVAINIVSPDDVRSRAEGDEEGDDYAVGTATENDVAEVLLVFFGPDNKVVEASRKPFDFTAVNETEPQVEKESDVMVAFDGEENLPTSFIALLNSGLTEADFPVGTTLAAVQAMTTDWYAEYEVEGTKSKYFTMSNSVYKDGANTVTTYPITEDNICSTEEEATLHPATAYVERVAVKLEATATASTTVTGKEVTLDGVKTTLTPSITGMAFYHTVPKAFLVKNITGMLDEYNDAANYRSYWAKSYEPNDENDEAYSEYSYQDIVGTDENVTMSLTDYVNENTSETTPTKLLVTATIDADNDGTPVDIFKFKGNYYTMEGLKKYVGQYLTDSNLSYTDAGGSTSTDWANVLTVGYDDTLEDWQGKIGVDATRATLDEDTKKAIDDLDEVWWWNGGRCYYYVDIKDVVRNHWVQIDINSISGLGAPVADSNKPIEPEEITEETYYVAAQINILKWKMVSQSVDFK